MGDLNSDCAVSPQCHQQMAISRPSSNHNSTNSKNQILFLLSLRHIVIYYHRVLWFFHFIIIFPSDRDQFMYSFALVVFQIKFLFTCHCTYMWSVTEHIWLPYYKYEAHNHCVRWPYRPNILEHMCQNTNNCNIYFIWYCHVCARN